MSANYCRATIFLTEAKDLPVKDPIHGGDFFCELHIHHMKFRSRVIEKTIDPQWQEEFLFFPHDYGPKKLEVSVFNWNRTLKNEIIGNTEFNLQSLEYGKTHDCWLNIEEKSSRRGSVHLFIRLEKNQIAFDEVDSHEPPLDRQLKSEDQNWEEVLDVPSQPESMAASSLGNAMIKFLKISDLPVTKKEQRSIFCVLQLGKVIAQTYILLKSAPPEWICGYDFPIKDIHAILEIVVMDKDVKGKTNMLGCIGIPLRDIQSGQRKSYLLKDRRLKENFKVRITLEVDLQYDLVRAALRTLRPKEDVSTYLHHKHWSEVLVQEAIRIKELPTVITSGEEYVQYFFELLTWKIPHRSITAYIVYVLTVCFFQLYWIPVSLLLLLFRGYINCQAKQPPVDGAIGDDEDSVGSNSTSGSDLNSSAKFSVADESVRLMHRNVSSASYLTKYFSAVDELVRSVYKDVSSANCLTDLCRTGSNLKNYALKNMRTAHDQAQEKIYEYQDNARFVYQALEFTSEFCERLCNTCNFTVPWLSYFAVFGLLAATVVLYVFPLRLIMLIWGSYEFAKGYFGHTYFELYSFLSRVYTKHECEMFTSNEIPVQ